MISKPIPNPQFRVIPSWLSMPQSQNVGKQSGAVFEHLHAHLSQFVVMTVTAG